MTDSFAAFWALYPRRVAKRAAEKAWARCATSPEVIEQIMAGLRAQKQAWGILDPKTIKFVPHPASWLNGHRWEDSSLEFAQRDKPRVIACERCGDTGVVGVGEWSNQGVKKPYYFVRCSCPIGQLPGVLAGISDAKV